MLIEQVEQKQPNTPNVGFKLQISKEKIEQQHLNNSFKHIEEAIYITQKEQNLKRLLLLFITYSFFILIINSCIYFFITEQTLSLYIYSIFNLFITFTFLYLSKRQAPINEADIKKTVAKNELK